MQLQDAEVRAVVLDLRQHRLQGSIRDDMSRDRWVGQAVLPGTILKQLPLQEQSNAAVCGYEPLKLAANAGGGWWWLLLQGQSQRSGGSEAARH